ncbi:hypothetical protein [Halobellus clavatus]|uniref:SipW-cognate class signal peptide n=1 Tax=Halobellus clavatus TaxID=660517 RepID=A0A1H3H532_9EURY|nr:hypothetical protein [Halobellus clavatus]SDY10315.1 hypothetical protein SAMN04487946_106158 [Halobellus clavatus]
MSDPAGSRDGPSGLSRRSVLYAAAATGAAAASGSGVAALLTDTEQVKTRLSAGTLDLDVAVLRPPSWTDGTYTGKLVLHEEQTATFELSVDTNPAFVWLMSPCPTCDDVESKIEVELELTRPGSGTTTLFTGTLDAFREAYGRGGLLSTQALAGSTETWTVTFTWLLLEPLAGDRPGRGRGTGRKAAAPDIGFEFEFRAIQERHLGDPEQFDLGLPACPDCEPECGTSISFVAFCGDGSFEETGLSFETIECGGNYPTLTVTEIPSGVDTVVLKYASYMDVFRYDGEETPFRVTTGGGDSDLGLIATHERESGNEHTADGQPSRYPNDPCSGDNWVKYEFDDDGTVVVEPVEEEDDE